MAYNPGVINPYDKGPAPRRISIGENREVTGAIDWSRAQPGLNGAAPIAPGFVIPPEQLIAPPQVNINEGTLPGPAAHTSEYLKPPLPPTRGINENGAAPIAPGFVIPPEQLIAPPQVNINEGTLAPDGVNRPLSQYAVGTEGLPGLHGNTVYVGQDGREYDLARGITANGFRAPAPRPNRLGTGDDGQVFATKDIVLDRQAPPQQPAAQPISSDDRAGPGDGDHPAPAPRVAAASHAAPPRAHSAAHPTQSAIAKWAPKDVGYMQRRFAEMGEDLGKTGEKKDGVDCDPGPKTQAIFERVCREAGVDPNKINPNSRSADGSKLEAYISAKVAQHEQAVVHARVGTEVGRHTNNHSTPAAHETVVVGELCSPKVPNCKAGGQGKSIG